MSGESKRGVAPTAVVASVLALCVVGESVVLRAFIVPRYAELYAEFGGDLPPLTTLCLGFLPYLGAALVAVAALGLAALAKTRGSLALAALALVTALAVGAGLFALVFYAMYAPLYELAGQIQ